MDHSHREQISYLLQQLDSGIAFATAAGHQRDPERRQTNRAFAEGALETVSRLLAITVLDDDDRARLFSRVEALMVALDRLDDRSE